MWVFQHFGPYNCFAFVGDAHQDDKMSNAVASFGKQTLTTIVERVHTKRTKSNLHSQQTINQRKRICFV